MKIPKKLKVGGLIYTVEIVDSLDTQACGVTDTKVLRIRLERATPESMEASFCHELVHAMNGEFSETDAEFLGRGLYQVITDNKEIFK